MQIRAEQMQVFLDRQRTELVDSLVAELAPRAPEASAAPADASALTQVVRAAVERAIASGITLGADIRRFVDFRLRLGPGFGEDPESPARAILDDPELTGTEKINELDAYELFGEQESAS